MEHIDPNVTAVVQRMLNRAHFGLIKYGVTTERTDIDLKGWLQHLQEELMDATIYIERIKKEQQQAEEQQRQAEGKGHIKYRDESELDEEEVDAYESLFMDDD